MIRDARNPWKHSYFRVRSVPLSSDGARSVLVRDAVYGGCDKEVRGVQSASAAVRMLVEAKECENKVVLDYGRDSDKQEEGELHDVAEADVPIVQSVRSNGATASSVAVLQTSTMNPGNTAGW
ncbi:hypothetical protein NDU88_002218 [Pleurodeles waltl]|uniref:Uncharacterized protein n=1 Tax=Pleurodeles waltl TaxID=8319 RepID=A0AAV7MQS2_PLEWA|nr:hypothetical protein NDU88_002218 [Pleurodeles waltl]